MIKKILSYRCNPFLFGVFRISFGVYLIWYLLLYSNRWIEFYGPEGISPIKLQEHFTLYRPSVFSYIQSENGLWVYFGIALVMAFAFTLGLFKKLPALFLWITLVSIQNSNSNNVNAEEYSLTVFAFYALLMPINATLRFDLMKRKFIESLEPVAAWMLIPFFVHIELIYIISLPIKPISDYAWIDGTLLYYAVNTFDLTRIPGAYGIFQKGDAVLSRVLTWASLLVEALFPIFVWTRKYRVWSILGMVSFQVGIAILLAGVQMFSLSMLLALLLFLPPDESHKFALKFTEGLRGFFSLKRTNNSMIHLNTRPHSTYKAGPEKMASVEFNS